MNKDEINEVLKKYNNLISINLIENKILYVILHIKYDSYLINIITDNDKYCYGETLEDIVDLSIFNINMIINSKKIETIFEILNKFIIINNKNIKTINTDPFNIYKKLYENTKYKIDYDNLLNIKLKEKLSKYNYLHDKIPKDLLLSSLQIKKLIINEIKKINRNNNYEHYVIPEDNNIFSLIIRLKFNKNNNLFDIFNKYNYDYMEFKLILDSTAYPYFPPKLEYIKPKINYMLFMSLTNLDILKYNKWNPLISLEYLIINIANEVDKVPSNYILSDINSYNNLEYNIMKLSSLVNKDFTNILNIDYNINLLSQDNKNNYWKAGTGYGHSNTNSWDIKNYVKDQEIFYNNITNILYNINLNINNENKNIILDSILITYLINQIKELNILEIEKNKNLYDEIFNILNNLIDKNIINQEIINNISNVIINIYDELELFFNTLKETSNNLLLIKIHTNAKWFINNNTNINSMNNTINNNNNELYISTMKKLQFNTYELPEYHRFIKFKDNKLNQQALMRILSETTSFKSSLPLNWDSSIWIRLPKGKFNILSFMISGPKDTPYENGLFEFHAYFNNNYPETNPEVLLHTTGNNTFRFNPNLYDNGKVCLSLLGTWSGNEEEKWNSKTSTFLQVMVSIQSLILIEQPYFNEPGFEKYINTDKGKHESNLYNKNIHSKTIELAMINMINNPPQGFEDVVNEHFKMKKDEILKTTSIWNNNNDNVNIMRDKLINIFNCKYCK
jgi:ubiquitin-protein ligase